jgi:hypothetical protein
VNRYKAIAQPVSSNAEGIYIPLDVKFEAEGVLNIWIPSDLESYADSVIMAEVMRYYAKVPHTKIVRTSGTVPQNDKGDFFVMGYMSELLSTQSIKQIKYNRDSDYTLGRACARVKLLMACVDQSKIPSTYLHIPDRFMGGISQFKEPEVTRALRTFYTADDAKHIERLLSTLASHVVKQKREEVKAKMDVGLFALPEVVVNYAKRKVTITDTKAGKGKKKTHTETLTPTKPSLLATVGPWERNAISEMYEGPWIHEKRLVEEFKKIPHLDRNYVQFRKELSRLFESQWASKQKVLRSTTHRLGGYPGQKEDPLFKKLNWIRDSLKEFGSVDQLPSVVLADFDPHALIPGYQLLREDGSAVSFPTYLTEDEGKRRFPHTVSLMMQYEGFQNRLATRPPGGL